MSCNKDARLGFLTSGFSSWLCYRPRVTLGKSLNLSRPQLPICKIETIMISPNVCLSCLFRLVVLTFFYVGTSPLIQLGTLSYLTLWVG